METGVPLVLGDDSKQKQTGQTDGSLTLGRMLGQMFDEYLICKSGLRSVFRASINIFHRKQQQQQEDRCSRLNYDGLLCFLASDMVEIFVSRFGYLGCESPNFAQQDFYIASLAADTTSNMFDPPKELENPISTLGMHLVMQLVEVCWFSMHPLSPLVSKTLLLSGIKDGTVDETLLAVILADACEIFSSTNTEAKTALHDGDGGKDRGDQTQQTMAYFAAMLLKSRPFPLSELATIPTAQAMVLLGWRDLSLGNARRGSCYVGYACVLYLGSINSWGGGRGHGQTNTMNLNGIAISRVEKEILQNIYWLRLLSATWSLMQIDQPFSLLVPNEFPDLPSLDETTSTILQLDRASGNISALHSQTQNICWMWPLSYVTITVAQIYILHLNAPSEARKDQIPPSSFLLRSDLDQSTVASGIRDYFLQAIHFVEHEATTLSSQSFLLTAYHTVLIYMLFSSSEEQSPPPTASPTVHALCESTMALLVFSERLSQPIGPMPTHRTYSAHTLVLALNPCSRALVHICMECEQEYIADLDTTGLL